MKQRLKWLGAGFGMWFGMWFVFCTVFGIGFLGFIAWLAYVLVMHYT